MSQYTNLFGLENCVESRLWFTSYVIRRIKAKADFSDDNGAADLCRSIASYESSKGSSWITYKLLILFPNHEENNINNWQLNVLQLRKALQLIDKNVLETIVQEFIQLRDAITVAKQGTGEISFQISAQSLEFLTINLWRKPALVQWIIDQLLCIWCTLFSNTDSALQDIYVNVIHKIFTIAGSSMVNNNSQSLYSPKNINFMDYERLATLLCILSKFNIIESKEQKHNDWLCNKLFEVCRFEDVGLAFYSRKDQKYFKVWNIFLENVTARNENIDNVDNALKISSSFFGTHQDFPMVLNINELFIRMLKRQTHWLSDIIDVSYALTINNRLDNIADTLGNPIFNSLWLPLLLKVLNDCPNVQITCSNESREKISLIIMSLRLLLKNCEPYTRNDSTISQVQNAVENHLNALDWIVNCKKLACENEKSPGFTHQSSSIKQIFQHLELSSVLSVIKMFIPDIHNKPFVEIDALLTDTKRSKTIYQAYYTMSSALKAILLCHSYNSEFIAVADHYSEMEKHLNNIYPLNLRLEIIENIFSMIFLRHEDFLVADNTPDHEEDDSDSGKCHFLPQKTFRQYETGFICNKYAIRETLHYLSRCVFVANENLSELKMELNSRENVKKLEQRILIVQNFLTEASWRLKLLTNLKFFGDQGLPYLNINSSLVMNKFTTAPEHLQSKSKFYKLDDSPSDEMDLRSDVNVSSENGSLNNSTQQNCKCRKRSKNNNSFDESLNKKESKHIKEFTLNYMLVSKESLILRCLWKDDYAEAENVIEIFNMEKSPLAGEIMFTRAMRIFRDDITKQLTLAAQYYSDVDKFKLDSKHSTLDFIRKAARDGIRASRTASQVETFLASQKSNIFKCSDSNNLNEIMALTTIDLALTMGYDNQISENLAEVAMKHLRTCKKLENTRFYEFFDIIYQLYYEKKRMSIAKIICDATIPLSLKEQKEGNEYWADLARKLKAFEMKTILIDIINDEHGQGEIKNHMKKILSVCDNGKLYVHRLDAHIDLLRTVAPQSKRITSGMKLSLLENSVDFYIGHQIFDLNIDLEVLETTANQLQINLVYGILANCCPKLSCCDNFHNNNYPHDFKILNDRWGTIILNKYETMNDEYIYVNSQDPNQCVVEILRELLEIMRDPKTTSLNLWQFDRTKNPDKMESVQTILKKTQCLINLDLSHLSFGNHTLAFFLNVWNLMMLHAIIQIWRHNLPLNDLQHAISLTTVGYEIGDLGFVTLFTLRKKLLGQSLCNIGILDFEYAEDLNEPAWQDLDLQQDSHVIFAMINEYVASPIIKIYYPEALSDELYSAFNDYLQHYVNIQDENIFRLPQLVQKYCNFFANTDATKTLLETFFKDNTSIEYETFEYLYDVQLEYVNEKSINFNCVVENVKDCNEAAIWMGRTVKSNILQYLEGHCWLLSYLVQRIHGVAPTLLTRTKCVNIVPATVLENLLNSESVTHLKSLFDDNQTVTGLWRCTSTSKLWHQLDIHLKDSNFQKCLIIVDALPHSLIMTNVEIQSFRDKILVQLINNQSIFQSKDILQYLYQIKDVQILAQIVLANVKKWPLNICEESLRHVLSHVNKNNLPIHCRAHINEILCRLMVYHKILPHCNVEYNIHWYNIVYRAERSDPICIVKSLIDTNQHELCLKWLKFQTVSSEIQSLVSQDLFIGLVKNKKNDFQHARQLLQALPISLSIKLCKGAIEKLESNSALRFILKYLLDNCPKEKEKYQRSSIGVEILDLLDSRDRGMYINLINNPLLMLEQLLMNGKFDSLQRIMKNYSKKLNCVGIPSDDFDCLVRFYAKKSLDSRVATQRDMIDSTRWRDASSNDSSEFIMPVNTPTRDEWIPNDKARECSCCRVVVFSMFYRRHHCRRCGRIICASCSSQRMQVRGYTDSVLVRVCNDCKRQTALQAQGTSSTASSETFDCWRLTNDETHNRTLREEFCFEYAPNISLCLAILNLHSDHKAYVNFLLDRCDEMKKLLTPDTDGRINPEIDHSIIINMIRSLLVAAKVKCAKLGLNTCLVDCDRFLSQIDLIATLVQSDCFALIPRDDLDDHTLPRLRDSLTEKEQWILALDLSTKSGLETQGVWAAWGKVCLKVGYYEAAREKFSHCLQKVHQEDFDDWILLSHPSNLSERSETELNMKKKESKVNETLKNRPTKDPPLLMEILQILEVSNSKDECCEQLTRTTSNAQEIFNTLNSLKAIAHGQYTISKLNFNSRNFRYEESLYYLLMYGSFNSILDFFVRYGEYDKYLSCVLDNNIEPELFFNIVFIGCLKNGTMETLCTTMKSKDPTLLVWKKYLIFTCHQLEKKQLLHTLYQLQLFMHDYIRAAMTCIRFYVMDASNYVDLCSRNYFLLNAQKHLEAELQVESFGKHRRKSTTSTISGHNSFIMEMEPTEIDRHINTISRQMEIAKFLGTCENEGRCVNEFLSKLSFMDSEGLQPRTVPTLFGNQQERTHLSVLAILCGRDVEEGFGISFRVMQDYNLRPQKVYSLVGYMLALDKKINSIEQLIKCCRSSGARNSNTISDRVLAHCVKFLLDRARTETNPGPKDQIDSLIRIITDVELKIGSYIESRQLKAAYLLAIKHSRAQDIRKILKEADRLGQTAIKSICNKWLQQTQQS